MSARELITEHLDLWTGAVTHKSTAGRGRNGKIELTGIKKLRELILELAVRGKLVDQDPNDEPASVLLERIADEKARLVKEGKAKKSQTIPTAIGSTFAHEAPNGWVDTTLEAIGYWAIGNGFPKHEQGESDKEILFCKVSDMNLSENSKEIRKTTNTVSHETAKKLKLNIHQAGTVIFPKIGGAISTNKRRTIVQPTAIDNNCLGITPSCGISSSYLRLFLTSIDMTEYQAGTSVPALSQNVIGKILLCLPPLEEQHRIVDKVDELMALCDRLEQQVGEQLEAHDVLVDTLLDALTRSADAAEVADNWARISEHFDTLFTTESSIDKLKQAILQLAVMGRLVEQDPNDEPASVLLERIAEEKARLVKEGKIKKPKKLPEVALNDLPSPLPRGWMAVTLSHLGVFCGGKTPSKSKSEFWNGDIPWVTPKDMKFAEITDTEDHVTDAATASGGLELLPQSAVLFVVRSGILRRMLPTAITRTQCTINQDLKALQLFKPDMARYIQIMSWGFEGFILTNLTKTGTTVESLKFSDFSLQALPLPPWDEQHRIVEKVDELIALCDRLKARLGKASETRTHLAEAVVEQAVQ